MQLKRKRLDQLKRRVRNHQRSLEVTYQELESLIDGYERGEHQGETRKALQWCLSELRARAPAEFEELDPCAQQKAIGGRCLFHEQLIAALRLAGG